jgi:hypothetical protein
MCCSNEPGGENPKMTESPVLLRVVMFYPPNRSPAQCNEFPALYGPSNEFSALYGPSIDRLDGQ